MDGQALWTGVGALAAAVGMVWLATRWVEWSQLYHPRVEISNTPDDAGLEYEDVEFVAEDAIRLHGWWIPSPSARGSLIYCHGNGENVGDLVGLAADLRALGVNVFLFDYRGYGRSRGWPTERGTYRDARAAFEYVRARHGQVEHPPIVALGRSLGGAVAAQLALDKPLQGLILESTFASTAALGRLLFPRLPVERLCRYRYDTLSKMPRIAIPLLVAHSPEDGLIPLSQAQALYETAPGPKQFVLLSGTHNEAGWRRTPAYLEALRAFLARTLGEPAATATQGR